MATPNINVKADSGTSTQFIVYGVVAVVVLGVAYFGIIKPILNNLGITKDANDREADDIKDDVTRTQVLSDLLYKANKSKATISSAKANTSALQIYNAKWGGWGGLSDKETQAVGAITSAGSLVNVSYIAYVFQQVYGVSLESYLDSFLESENWITIDAYLKKTKQF
jgi:hypothetical protein